MVFHTPDTYRAGVYRFLDADGNLVEQTVDWCQLVINENGLKLAIILPVGLVVTVGLFAACTNLLEKRREAKLAQLVAYNEPARKKSEKQRGDDVVAIERKSVEPEAPPLEDTMSA